MNSGGYSGYMDCYPNTDAKELEEAILSVANKEIAANYSKAVTEGEADDWEKQIPHIMTFLHHCAITFKNMLKRIRQLYLVEIVTNSDLSRYLKSRVVLPST